MHYELFGDIRMAIAREKEIKKWRHQKKVWLIECENPRWEDFSAEWFPKDKSGPKGKPLTADSSHGQNAAGSE